MSFTRKTLKILALIYFVLGIASLVIGIAGITTGNLDSMYGSNAMLAAVVLVVYGRTKEFQYLLEMTVRKLKKKLRGGE